MYQNWPIFNNPILPNGEAFALLKRVSSIKEIEDAPVTTLNSENVYLNKDDDTIMYIRRIDSSGKCTVKRYRYYEDPEPTQQQINDGRYVTKEDFDAFKKDIFNAIKQTRGKQYNGSKPNESN